MCTSRRSRNLSLVLLIMGMLDLDADRIAKAFKRTKDMANISEDKLVLVTEEYYDDVIAFDRDIFSRDEPLNRTFQVKWTSKRAEFWRSILQQGLSLAIMNNDSGEVMAIQTMSAIIDKPSHNITDLDDPGMKNLFQFLNHCRQNSRLFEKLGVSEAVMLHALGVHPKYRNQGLATKIFRAAVTMLRNLDLDSVCVTGEASSPAAKKLFERNGFMTLFDLPHKEYLSDGNPISVDTGGNKSHTVYGLLMQRGK